MVVFPRKTAPHGKGHSLKASNDIKEYDRAQRG